MKKCFNLLFAFVLVFSLILVNGTDSVSAKTGDASQAAVAAGGSWSTGSEVEIDLKANPAPIDWYQLLAKGVKITAPGKICHEFRGGQYHWIADIRQLVKGKWVKIPTTQGWLNGEESPYAVCAEAPSAGTYALFGYYNGPTETISTNTCSYDMSSWNALAIYTEGSDMGIKVNLSHDVPKGLAASFRVATINGSYESPLSGTTTTWHFEDEEVSYSYALFTNTISYTGDWTIQILFTMGDCSRSFTVSNKK